MGATKELSARLLGPLFSRGRSKESQLTLHRGFILILTFIVYATFHASRRPLAIVKAEFTKNCTETSSSFGTNGSNVFEGANCGWAPFDGESGKSLLAALDSCYLFLYAFCMFASGYFAERSNLRVFLAVWLAICGAICIAFGLARVFEIHSLWYFIVLQLAAGVAQTSGWPAVVGVVGEWFGSTKKGLILGLWNWHTSVGNIMGTAVAGAFVESNWGLSFIVPGLICIAVGLTVFLFLIPKPHSVGLHVDFSSSSSELDVSKSGKIYPKSSKQVENSQTVVGHSEEAITIWKAIRIPGVIDFAVCLFFAKLVSYTFLFWLPLYLEETSHLSSSSSAFQSIMFDIGGCLGSLLAGFLSDRTGASALTCILFFTVAIPSLYSYYLWSATSMLSNEALQFLVGAFVNGPYALITTAVSANLACKVPSQAAMATVSAIIDGTGSIGAAIGPLLAGLVSGDGQWDRVFYMCILADIIAIISLSRVAREEYTKLRNKRHLVDEVEDSP